MVFTRTRPARRPRRRRRLASTSTPGETVGLVGESGSGKSVTSLAIMGLLPDRGVRVGGQVCFDGDDLLTLPEDRSCATSAAATSRWSSRTRCRSLNPVVPIGIQVTEVLERTAASRARRRRDAAAELLDAVGIPRPEPTAQGLPAPALRRDAPAGDDRHGAGLPARGC